MKRIFLVTLAVIIIAIAVVSFFYILIQSDTSESETLNITQKPFLWIIEGNNPSYLYGSIHLGNKDILTLPDVVVDAIEDADILYWEVELDTETQMRSAELSLLTGGETLSDLLPQDVIDRLDLFLAPIGIDHTAFSQYKIWTVASSLILLDEIQDLMNYGSLDEYIWKLALSKGKETGGIETVEEQVGIFDSFTISEQIDLLINTLDSLEEYDSIGKSITDEMKSAYLLGDLELLQDLSLSDYDENDPINVKLRNRLIKDRNYNMTQRIYELIIDNPNTQYFFTIGAGHFYGDDGLITLLEGVGFTINRIEFENCEECDSGEVKIEEKCYIPYSK
ncbi:MAG: TraB/GumN family protein [Candidatus Hodarchaeales archaeon]